LWADAPVGGDGFGWQRFAVVWSAFIFVFFSVSGSKLPSYILPMFPALALTLGWQLTVVPQTVLARLTLPLVAIMGVIALIMIVAYTSLASRFVDALQHLPPLLDYCVWPNTACYVAFACRPMGLFYLRSGKWT